VGRVDQEGDGLEGMPWHAQSVTLEGCIMGFITDVPIIGAPLIWDHYNL